MARGKSNAGCGLAGAFFLFIILISLVGWVAWIILGALITITIIVVQNNNKKSDPVVPYIPPEPLDWEAVDTTPDDNIDKIEHPVHEKLTEMEETFIVKLKMELYKVGKSKKFSYVQLSNRTIKCLVDGKEIGKVKLNGRIYKIKIADSKDWVEIANLDEALEHLPQWVNYSLNL